MGQGTGGERRGSARASVVLVLVLVLVHLSLSEARKPQRYD